MGKLQNDNNSRLLQQIGPNGCHVKPTYNQQHSHVSRSLMESLWKAADDELAGRWKSALQLPHSRAASHTPLCPMQKAPIDPRDAAERWRRSRELLLELSRSTVACSSVNFQPASLFDSTSHHHPLFLLPLGGLSQYQSM